MNSLVARPEFMDLISQAVRLRPAKIVSEFSKTADSNEHLSRTFLGNASGHWTSGIEPSSSR